MYIHVFVHVCMHVTAAAWAPLSRFLKGALYNFLNEWMNGCLYVCMYACLHGMHMYVSSFNDIMMRNRKMVEYRMGKRYDCWIIRLNVCVCMCVCMCVYACVYVSMSVYECMCICIYVCMHVYIYSILFCIYGEYPYTFAHELRPVYTHDAISNPWSTVQRGDRIFASWYL